MKFLIGALVIALTGLGTTAWLWQQSAQREAVALEQLRGVREALVASETQNQALAERLDRFGKAVTDLAELQRANQAETRRRLDALKNITQEPGDSDETIACVDLPVPAGVDRGLR